MDGTVLVKQNLRYFEAAGQLAILRCTAYGCRCRWHHPRSRSQSTPSAETGEDCLKLLMSKEPALSQTFESQGPLLSPGRPKLNYVVAKKQRGCLALFHIVSAVGANTNGGSEFKNQIFPIYRKIRHH